MIASILNSIKKTLNVPADYDAFDADILMHINSVFSRLSQLGIGPQQGFAIQDDTVEWSAYVTDDRLNNVQSYMYLRVRLLFDPPDRAALLTSYQAQIKEMEWLINAQREDEQWTPPQS